MHSSRPRRQSCQRVGKRMADDGDGWDDDDGPMFPPPPDDDAEATAPVTEGDAAILDSHRLSSIGIPCVI